MWGAWFASIDGTSRLAYDFEYIVMSLLTPPPLESTQALVFVEQGGLGVVVFHSPEPIGQVVPASDEVVASNALAPVSEAL